MPIRDATEASDDLTALDYVYPVPHAATIGLKLNDTISLLPPGEATKLFEGLEAIAMFHKKSPPRHIVVN